MIAHFLKATLGGMYDKLAICQAASPADLIFVLAGLPERKRYGWELFQQGLAPVLLLSVARSEARFLSARAGIPDDGNIISLLPICPDQGNHIFLWFDRGGVRPEVIRLPELNTFGEIWALSTLSQRHRLRHVLILSTAIHLRRIRYAVHKSFGSTAAQISYLGVPEDASICRGHRWWSRRSDARLVIGEWIKLAGYHVKYDMLQRHHRYVSPRRGATGLSC
jgi:hypothetical protein